MARLLADGTVSLAAEHAVNAKDAIEAVADYCTGRITGKVAVAMSE